MVFITSGSSYRVVLGPFVVVVAVVVAQFDFFFNNQ